MTRIDKFKEYLGSGEKIFLEEYEPAINELLDNLNQDGLLKTYFTPTRIARLQKLMTTSNAAAHLFNNANKIFAHDDEEKINSNMRKLEELGLGLEVDVEQYITILCHMYQVTSERLKLHLVTLINFPSLGLSDADKRPLGPLIQELKSKYPQNKFIRYLDTKIRNAVTHYTYFFEEGVINLCNRYFDSSPNSMKISDFMIESKRLNILTEAFFIIFLDKHRPGNDLIIDIS